MLYRGLQASSLKRNHGAPEQAALSATVDSARTRTNYGRIRWAFALGARAQCSVAGIRPANSLHG